MLRWSWPWLAGTMIVAFVLWVKQPQKEALRENYTMALGTVLRKKELNTTFLRLREKKILKSSHAGTLTSIKEGQHRYVKNKKHHQEIDPFLMMMGGTKNKPKDRKHLLSSKKLRTFGIFVGISQFNKYQRLKYATSDACRIMEAFLRHGKMKKEHVRLLIQEPRGCSGIPSQKPTEQLFRHLIGTWLPSQLRRGDRVVIFFSSHGEFIPGEGYYLVFPETSSSSLSSSALEHRALKRMLDRLNARQQFVFLDTCHSGGVSAKMLLVPQPLKVLQSEGRFIFASSKASQLALQYSAVKMSLFSYILEKALLGYADANNDGIVDHLETARYLWSWVPRVASQRFKHEQTPVVWGISNGLLPLTWVKKRPSP